MRLVGCEKITSKKTGQVFCKLHLLSPVKPERGVGEATSTEFVEYNEDFFALVGEEIKIFYTKGFSGQAIVDHIEPV